jgi:RES domain-containing protein
MVARKYCAAIASDEGARRAGGRYNPPGVGALYLGESEQACRAELKRHVEPLPELVLGVLDVRLGAVCDLTDPAVRSSLGITESDFTGDDWVLTQALGVAIRAAGFEAVLAPSAAGAFSTLAIFQDRLDTASFVRVRSTAEVNG